MATQEHVVILRARAAARIEVAAKTLAARFEVVEATELKNVPGRDTDLIYAQQLDRVAMLLEQVVTATEPVPEVEEAETANENEAVEAEVSQLEEAAPAVEEPEPMVEKPAKKGSSK